MPIVDGPGGVIPEPPEILATYQRKIPMMLGTTRDESSLKICKRKEVLLCTSFVSVLLDDKELNITAMDKDLAEQLAENLTHSYPGFVNHPLIGESCKHEYIWTKVDPAYDAQVLHDSVLKVHSE